MAHHSISSSALDHLRPMPQRKRKQLPKQLPLDIPNQSLLRMTLSFPDTTLMAKASTMSQC